MKKLLLVLIALCIFAVPVLAQDETSKLSNQQLLAVYDAVVAEIQRRGVDTSAATPRDSSVKFGENIHIQTGELTVCLPDTSANTDSGLLINQTVQLPIAPTATPIPLVGDKASYDSQYPMDGTHFKAGQTFDITWYLLNTGTTTWTKDYCLRFFTGTNMTKPGKPRYHLDNPVAPNTVGACAIDAVAPSKPGTYTMSVVLGNENDENFYIMDITIVVD